MINGLAIDNVFNYFSCDRCEGDRSVVSGVMPIDCSFCVLVQHVPVSMVLECSLDVLT